MPPFELPLDLRVTLCRHGFHDVDAAIRFAAVELDIWLFSAVLHSNEQSDGNVRHFTQFLVWADTALVGIDTGVSSSGEHALIQKWEALSGDPLRQRFRKLRNQALKERDDVAPWHAKVLDDSVVMYRTLLGDGPIHEPYGQAHDYLVWIRSRALPLLLEAIEKGVHGRTPADPEFSMGDQMAFPRSDPWTPRLDPEHRALFAFLDSE